MVSFCLFSFIFASNYITPFYFLFAEACVIQGMIICLRFMTISLFSKKLIKFIVAFLYQSKFTCRAMRLAENGNEILVKCLFKYSGVILQACSFAASFLCRSSVTMPRNTPSGKTRYVGTNNPSVSVLCPFACLVLLPLRSFCDFSY